MEKPVQSGMYATKYTSIEIVPNVSLQLVNNLIQWNK
jgi:hypothetical protein